jgi:hypothetical protein
MRSPLLEPPFGGQIRLAPNLIQLRRIAARFAPLQVIDSSLAESRDLVLHLGDRSPELGDLAAEISELAFAFRVISGHVRSLRFRRRVVDMFGVKCRLKTGEGRSG